MSKHTKGPWRQGSASGHNATTIFPDTEDRHADAIASVYGIPMHTTIDDVSERYAAGMANARLISCAPELLEALEHFAAFPLEDFGWEDKKPDHPITGFNSWKLTVGHILAIRAAIAKARGES